MGVWNPWTAVGRLKNIVVKHVELPPGVWGLTDGATIWLNRALGQTRRRCTLTHELVHLERGLMPADRRGHDREERAVSAEASRRLITLDALADALRWTRDPAQLAEELWVDPPTLRARMAGLTAMEATELEQQLDGATLWIP